MRLADAPLRIGMIGLDTSHCPIFTDAINTAPAGSDEGAPAHRRGVRIK